MTTRTIRMDKQVYKPSLGMDNMPQWILAINCYALKMWN